MPHDPQSLFTRPSRSSGWGIDVRIEVSSESDYFEALTHQFCIQNVYINFLFIIRAERKNYDNANTL